MSLFGGSSREDILTRGQGGLLDKVTNMARNELGRGADFYTGQLVAGGNANLTSAFTGIRDASRPNPALQGAITDSLGGAGDPAGVRSYYDTQLAPAKLEFDRNLNEVMNRYADVWGSSGAGAEMAARATAEYGMGLNSMLGGMVYDDRNAARDRQVQAIPGAVDAQQARMESQRGLMDLGLVEQGQEQRSITADQAQWLGSQWYNNPALGLIGPALGTQAFAMGNQKGDLSSVVEAGTGIASVIGAFV